MTQEQIAEIISLENKAGRLTPNEVVDAARSEKSPLHDLFCWDNDTAAELYRVEQAREVIRRVKLEVVIEERTINLNRYVRDPNTETGKQGYVSMLKVRARVANEVMGDELRQLLYQADRCARIAEVKCPQVFARVDGLRNAISELAKEF